MKEITEYLIEDKEERKSMWREGPWIDEPDYVQGEYNGHRYVILRNLLLGNLCGYFEGSFLEDHEYPNVHGGITYRNEDLPRVGLIEKAPEDEMLHWYGFDCGHLGDIIPSIPDMQSVKESMQTIYKDINYVRQQLYNALDELCEKQSEE